MIFVQNTKENEFQPIKLLHLVQFANYDVVSRHQTFYSSNHPLNQKTWPNHPQKNFFPQINLLIIWIISSQKFLDFIKPRIFMTCWIWQSLVHSREKRGLGRTKVVTSKQEPRIQRCLLLPVFSLLIIANER